MHSQKGQAFASFRLLIAVVMASLMLVIILGGLTYIEGIKYRVSLDRLYQGAENAAKTPNGDVILVDNLTFAEGTHFSEDSFALLMGIDNGCLAFETWSSTTAFELSGSTISVTENIQTDVYIQCFLAGCGDLGIECTVSFGREIV